MQTPSRVVNRADSPTLLAAAGCLTAVALWEVITRGGLVPDYAVPPVSEIAGALWRLLGDASFWDAVASTLAGWGAGLAIGAAIGVPVGLLMGSSKAVRHALRPTVEFLRPVPSVALIPLAILLFGQSVKGAVFLIAFGVTWPMLIHAMYGVQQVDDATRQTVRSLRLRRIDRVRFVTLPSALPYIGTGLRICAAFALIIAVTAELVVGSPGIGKAMATAQQGHEVEEMYALICVAGLLGVVIHAVFARAESRFLRWRPQAAEA